MVLASISLIERHVKAASAFTSWWRHQNELTSMSLALDAERALFLDICKQLLIHIVPPNELETLLQNPSSPAWRSAELDLTLILYLGDTYSQFSQIVDGIANALDVLKTFLHLDTNGKVRCRQHLQPAIEPLTEQALSEDLSFREKQWNRLTLSLSRWYLCELINYIQSSNRMLAEFKDCTVGTKACQEERLRELRETSFVTSNEVLLSNIDNSNAYINGKSTSVHPRAGAQSVNQQILLRTTYPGDTPISNNATAPNIYQSSPIAQQSLSPYAIDKVLRLREKGIIAADDPGFLLIIEKLPIGSSVPEGSNAATTVSRAQQDPQQASSSGDEICAQNSSGQVSTVQGHQPLDELVNQLLAMNQESRSVSYPSFRTYNILVFAECFVILASFVVSLTWSLVKKDVQGGFTIGAYIVGVGTLLVAGIKAHFEKHFKRRIVHDIEL